MMRLKSNILHMADMLARRAREDGFGIARVY